ncbi:MAG: GHMP kinase [Chloroflexi bacterium]|nr:GHMP kinase [Chloroflexota bacterium]
MLIARAPVRISFAGGGTDLPAYFMEHGGAVVSTSIDKYVYVVLSVHARNDLQILSSDYRTFFRHTGGEVLFWEGDLNLPKAILHEFGIESGASMFLASEVPPGTGLGSSSTVTVASIKAVSAACGVSLSKMDLAEMAARIEIEKLAMPIGYQDQFGAAFGGLNYFEFRADGNKAEPLKVSVDTVSKLQSRLLLFFTGQARDSTKILAQQTENTKTHKPIVLDSLHAVRAMVNPMRECLEAGDVEKFGRLLHEGWELKKKFAAGVSNERVDMLYTKARNAGAMGGKLAGAGGGGFMMIYCEDGRQHAVTQAMEEEGLRRMDYAFDNGGARVLLNAGLRLTGNNK